METCLVRVLSRMCLHTHSWSHKATLVPCGPSSAQCDKVISSRVWWQKIDKAAVWALQRVRLCVRMARMDGGAAGHPNKQQYVPAPEQVMRCPC